VHYSFVVKCLQCSRKGQGLAGNGGGEDLLMLSRIIFLTQCKLFLIKSKSENNEMCLAAGAPPD
jgi:hypothetical protein